MIEKKPLLAYIKPRHLAWFVAINFPVTILLFWLTTSNGLFDSLYWAVVTGSTTGFGDVLPLTIWAKLVTIWFIASSVLSFTLGFAVLTSRYTAWQIENPFEKEVLDDTDDTLLLLGLICDHLGIAVPESVEEYHNKESHLDR